MLALGSVSKARGMLAPSADLSDERQEPSCSTLDHLVELFAQMGVGLDRYPHVGDLSGCIADALEMHRLLINNSNGDPNYSCAILTSNTRPALDLRTLKAKLRDHLEREKVTSAVV